MFFVIFWTALVRYTWLSNSSRSFSDNQNFRMFLVSMADIIGSNPSLNNALRASTPPLHFPLHPWIMPLLCEPNDAVWAVAVAKRREYKDAVVVCHSSLPSAVIASPAAFVSVASAVKARKTSRRMAVPLQGLFWPGPVVGLSADIQLRTIEKAIVDWVFFGRAKNCRMYWPWSKEV